MRHLLPSFAALCLLAAACSSGPDALPASELDPAAPTTSSTSASSTSAGPDAGPVSDAGETDSADTGATGVRPRSFPPAPVTPDGPLAPEIVADLDLLFGSLGTDPDLSAIIRLSEAGDPRVAWLFADILRFANPGTRLSSQLGAAWITVTATPLEPERSIWGAATDHLIAWDTPAPPGYVDWKRQVFELIEPGWTPFFADPDADIDWRHVSWGGVLIDDRELDETDMFCIDGCIPALDDPALVRAGTDADWLDDERPVFGLVVDGEAIAFPKNIMEIHEMVNMTLAERRVGIPYCTLCGSAQAYFTDVVDTLPAVDGVEALDGQLSLELRTSGLLIRSNKVMYEFHTKSVFDTFTGKAVSGPLRDAGVQLEQLSVLATTWGQWKAAHPDSWLIAEDGGIGRTYPPDPLAGRDDDGPIFPIGDADERLAVQASVIGVITDDGTAVAFSRDALDAATGTASLGGVTIEPSAGGYLAVDAAGRPLAAHEAFWFAWSQFHPGTLLWAG